MTSAEKRQYPRLALKVQDGYFAHCLLPDQSNLTAPIINLSASGLNMAVKPNDVRKLQEGASLLLQNIAGGISLDFLTKINAEIRWIKSFDHPTYIFVGCAFTNMSADVREQLVQFIHAERKSRGQYD